MGYVTHVVVCHLEDYQGLLHSVITSQWRPAASRSSRNGGDAANRRPYVVEPHDPRVLADDLQAADTLPQWLLAISRTNRSSKRSPWFMG
jgi:hypothetical protein